MISVCHKNNRIIYGHPDWYLVIENRFYIVDYKPECNFYLRSEKIGKHIVSTIPQVAGYGCAADLRYKLSENGFIVLCYTFNYKNGVIYNPWDALPKWMEFFELNKKNADCPWKWLIMKGL